MHLDKAGEPRFTRRGFLKTLGGMTMGAVALGLGGWTYAIAIEPDWIDVTPVHLRLPRLDPAFAGFRMAQLSDIHLSAAMTGEQLAAACQKVLELQPDLVAITGDFVDEKQDLQASLVDLVDGLRPLDGQVQVVFVLGNHDYWAGARRIRKALGELDFMELPNRFMTLTRGSARLHIAGVDDVWERKADLLGLLQSLPEDGAAVLLAHEPDFARRSAATGRFDLQISGHSHGGQVVLPFVGPPILPHLGKRYPSGLYQVSSMFQYTNRGLGTTSPHVRLNCRPEITLFTFDPPDLPQFGKAVNYPIR